MKQFTIFESAIIGFFVGVIIAAYMAFISSMGGFLGVMLGWLSLKPVLDMFMIPDNSLMIISFIFFVLVYTIYGVIVGVIMKSNHKAGLAVVLALVLLGGGATYEQSTGSPEMTLVPDPLYSVAAVTSVPTRVPKQYFGNEAIGDLNGDEKDDVAFMINRPDDERGTLYYLTTALTSDAGRTGTNLIFLGEKMNPQGISINKGIIEVDYLDMTEMNSTTTYQIYARIIDGILAKIDEPEAPIPLSAPEVVTTTATTSVDVTPVVETPQ